MVEIKASSLKGNVKGQHHKSDAQELQPITKIIQNSMVGGEHLRESYRLKMQEGEEASDGVFCFKPKHCRGNPSLLTPAICATPSRGHKRLGGSTASPRPRFTRGQVTPKIPGREGQRSQKKESHRLHEVGEKERRNMQLERGKSAERKEELRKWPNTKSSRVPTRHKKPLHIGGGVTKDIATTM